MKYCIFFIILSSILEAIVYICNYIAVLLHQFKHYESYESHNLS
jgi:hypothetical protein